MSVLNLINKLKVTGIELFLVDGDLELEASKEILTSKLIEEIKSNKVEIIKFLNDERQKGKCKYIHLEKEEKREYYPVSSAQKRMLVMHEMEESKLAYNMFNAVLLEGNLDVDRLEQAFVKLIERHEALRTTFIVIKNEYVQKIHNHIDFSIVRMECTEDNLCSTMKNFMRPIKLSIAPLFEVGLARVDTKKHALFINMHHIISDGASLTLLIKELLDLYAGKELSFPRLQYKDFTLWQIKQKQSEKLQKQEKYWLDIFARNEIPVLDLPTDYLRPDIQTFEGERYLFHIDKKLTNCIKELAQKTNSTKYMVLLAVYNILLYKHSSQNDIIVGSSIAKRNHFELQNIIGMMVNVLAMRNYPEDEKTFLVFLAEVRANALKAYENQDYQFDDLVDKLNLSRDFGRTPIFNTMFDFHNLDSRKVEIEGLKVLPLEYDEGVVRFDLELNIIEEKGELHAVLQYSNCLFKRSTIERLGAHFINILKHVIANPEVLLGKINLLSIDERDRILIDFNKTEWKLPKQKTMIDIFEYQVVRRPDDIAVIFGEKSLTYGGLAQRVNQLAGYIINEHKLNNEELIAILMDRSINMLVSILGVFKAGGAYIPLDAGYPEERIQTILDDAKIRLVISEKQYIRTLNRMQWQCECLETFLCIDSKNVYAEDEVEKPETMNEEPLKYIGESSIDQIEGGRWLSSFTGKHFSQKEIDEYGDNVFKKLKPYLHKDLKVLEIGCAAGITSFRIAPHVGYYYMTDVSREIIEKNRNRVMQGGYNNIELEAVPLHNIDNIREREFDFVIINSVTHYFPGLNYLRKGLRKVIDLMSPNGHIFIGDVMDQDLKVTFINEIIKYKYQNAQNKYRTKSDWSDKLFVSRFFLEDLTWEIPELCEVKFTDKNYTIENELTRYRYDAMFTVNKQDSKIIRRKPKKKNQHDQRNLAAYSDIHVINRSKPEDLAYVIYTSGSTGKPKGAMVEHIGMANHLFAKINELSLDEKSIIAQNASHCFDISVWQFMASLVVGGKTVIYPNELVLDAEKFIDQLIIDQVSILEVVPSYLTVMLDMMDDKKLILHKLKYLLVTGEILRHKLVKRWLKKYPDIYIVNAYGPTEASDDITHNVIRDIPECERISIGKPLQNFNIYIVNKNLELCPIGIKGEIVVSGVGVGRGYLNAPEKTAEVFSVDPFKPFDNIRLYRTGDVGRWLPDGNIEFFGRTDYQIKIRGFRIELGEIENVLMEHEAIKEAVVVVKENYKYICAYIVYEQYVDISELKIYLKDKLPEYMIPSCFIQMEKIPLTSNGKIDRKYLPEPQIEQLLSSKYEAPRNEMEARIAKIFGEILGIEDVGINDSFFDFGGDSLKAMIFMSKIQQYGLKIDIFDFFSEPTIRGLSKKVKRVDTTSIKNTVEGEISFMPIQKWFIEKNFTDANHYNRSYLIFRKEGFDVEMIKSIFNELLIHHDALRMTFRQESGRIVQYNQGIESCSTDIKVINLGRCSIQEEATVINRSINLATGPLLKIGVFKSDKGDYLLFAVHRIIADSISIKIILQDFITGMKSYLKNEKIQFPPKTDSYLHWVNTLKEYANSPEIQKQIPYWNKIEQTTVSLLTKDSDVPEKMRKLNRKSLVRITLDESNTGKLLNEVHSVYNTEVSDILLSAIYLSLQKFTGLDQFKLYMGGHGREKIVKGINISRTVGWFTTQYPVLISVGGDFSFHSTIKQVRDILRNIPQKGIGYGILRYLSEDQRIRFNLEPEISFNYIGEISKRSYDNFDELFKLADEWNWQAISPNMERHFPLDVVCGTRDGLMSIDLNFSEDEFKMESMNRFAKYYEDFLLRIIEHCCSIKATL